jgi:8-oxo-dGTP diphosphatase
MSVQIVVAGALIRGSGLLVAQRAHPPELAGRWELPGGKVADGETEPAALARELSEELGIGVAVGPRIGADVTLNPDGTMVLRAYLAQVTEGDPRAHEHRALRWVGAEDLDGLDWVPADRAWLPDLARELRSR